MGDSNTTPGTDCIRIPKVIIVCFIRVFRAVSRVKEMKHELWMERRLNDPFRRIITMKCDTSACYAPLEAVACFTVCG